MSDISEGKKIVVEHLGESDKVVDSASFVDDLGADLDTVELVMAFEEFNIEIPDEIVEKLHN